MVAKWLTALYNSPNPLYFVSNMMGILLKLMKATVKFEMTYINKDKYCVDNIVWINKLLYSWKLYTLIMVSRSLQFIIGDMWYQLQINLLSAIDLIFSLIQNYLSWRHETISTSQSREFPKCLVFFFFQSTLMFPHVKASR